MSRDVDRRLGDLRVRLAGLTSPMSSQRKTRALETVSATLIARAESSVRSMTPAANRARTYGLLRAAPPPRKREKVYTTVRARLLQLRARWASTPAEKLLQKYQRLADDEPLAPRFRMFWSEQLLYHDRQGCMAGLASVLSQAQHVCVDYPILVGLAAAIFAQHFLKARKLRVKKLTPKKFQSEVAAHVDQVEADTQRQTEAAAAADDDDRDFLMLRPSADLGSPAMPRSSSRTGSAPSSPRWAASAEAVEASVEAVLLAEEEQRLNSSSTSSQLEDIQLQGGQGEGGSGTPHSSPRSHGLPAYMRPSANWSGQRPNRVPFVVTEAASPLPLPAPASPVLRQPPVRVPRDSTAAAAEDLANSPKKASRPSTPKLGMPAIRVPIPILDAHAAMHGSDVATLQNRAPASPNLRDNSRPTSSPKKQRDRRCQTDLRPATKSTRLRRDHELLGTWMLHGGESEDNFGLFSSAEIVGSTITPVRRSRRLERKNPAVAATPRQAIDRSKLTYQPNTLVDLHGSSLEDFLNAYLEQHAIELSLKPL